MPGPGEVGRGVRRETAPAKINLFLGVGPRRPDGYHELLTVFESLPEPHDDVTVTITPSDGGWVFRAEAAPPPSSSVQALPRDLENLAGRAAERFAAALGEPAGKPGAAVDIRVTKGIPVAAGMGGGSSDAAAVLRALQAHFGSPLDHERLLRVAAELGSDVPFFLEGGRAVARGRGHELRPLPRGSGLPLVLGLPRFALATPDVYHEFDRLGGPAGGGQAIWVRREEHLAGLTEALAAGDLPAVAGFLGNDLERAAVSLCPQVREILGALRRAGCLVARVSGSGPAVFGLCLGKDEAARIARVAARLLPPGLRGSVSFLPVVSGVGPRPGSDN